MTISQEDIEKHLQLLDGSGSEEEWASVDALHAQLGDTLPHYLLQLYRSARKAGTRSSCLYHTLRYAKKSNEAIELGILGLDDRSKTARYRACMLLACSLRQDILPILRQKKNQATGDTQADLAAAIDAIEHQNHHFFVDRDHSGRVTLQVH